MAAMAGNMPNTWAEFLAELMVRAEMEKTRCIMSQPDMMQLMQGRAQQAMELVNLAKNCVREHKSVLDSAKN